MDAGALSRVRVGWIKSAEDAEWLIFPRAELLTNTAKYRAPVRSRDHRGKDVYTHEDVSSTNGSENPANGIGQSPRWILAHELVASSDCRLQHWCAVRLACPRRTLDLAETMGHRVESEHSCIAIVDLVGRGCPDTVGD